MSLLFKLFFLILFSLILLSCSKEKIICSIGNCFFHDTLEPPDKIKLNENIFLIKGPKNKKGCTQYFPSSKDGSPTVQVIYFYNKDKKITNSSNPKNCL
jgi:hypothetical protein